LSWQNRTTSSLTQGKLRNGGRQITLEKTRDIQPNRPQAFGPFVFREQTALRKKGGKIKTTEIENLLKKLKKIVRFAC